MEEDRPFKHRFIDLEWMQILCALIWIWMCSACKGKHISSLHAELRNSIRTYVCREFQYHIPTSVARQYLCLFVCARVCLYLYLWFYFMENQYQVEFQLINGSFGRNSTGLCSSRFIPTNLTATASFSLLFFTFRFVFVVPFRCFWAIT